MWQAWLVVCLVPACAYASYWEPGQGATQQTYRYTICDTIRHACYDASLEFVTHVVHGGEPYWVVRADMTILAGFPPGMEYPRGYEPLPWRITGDPVHDMELLEDSLPPGIPSYTFILLYDGILHAPFVDESRMLADSLHDTIFGLNDMMDGAGILRVGGMWGEAVVMEMVDGMFVVRYDGEGEVVFLVDPDTPIPLAGIYKADRYDPRVSSTMWFYGDMGHMDIILEQSSYGTVDVSGPDDVMRTGTLSGMTWTSDTYTVHSATISNDYATIRGHADTPGVINVVMPAFGSSYTFWQNGTIIPATYHTAEGVLTAHISHDTGDITIHAIPDGVCTGECVRDVVVRAWSGPSAIVYGSGFHGAVRMSLVPGDPNMIAPSVCPAGSVVTVDFDVMEPLHTIMALPYVTTYESDIHDIVVTREGSRLDASVSGESGSFTLRMPAMTGHVSYYGDGMPITPEAQSTYHDTVTATIRHSGGNASYVVQADGPSAWGSGLSLAPPAARTGAVWCGMSEPVNAMVIRDTGVGLRDCGVSKFDGGWNAWC